MDQVTFNLMIQGIIKGKIKEVDLSHKASYNAMLTLEQVQQLANTLTHRDNRVYSLNLSYNYLQAEAVTALATALQHKNNHVHTLNLSYIRAITPRSTTIISALAPALQHVNNHVHTLELVGNSLQAADIAALSLVLQDKNNRVHALNLESNRIDKTSVIALVQVLQHVNNHIRTLDLSYNSELGNGGIAALAQALTNINNHLHTLRLSTIKLRTEDITALVSALKHPNNHIHTLDLSQNNFKAEDIMALVSALQHENNHIHTLSLDDVGLSNYTAQKREIKGITALAPALQHKNNHIHTLNLRRNGLPDESIGLLISVLQHENNHIHTLNLDDNLFQKEDAIKTLLTALQHANSRIYVLDLNNPRSINGRPITDVVFESTKTSRKAYEILIASLLSKNNLPSVIVDIIMGYFSELFLVLTPEENEIACQKARCVAGFEIVSSGVSSSRSTSSAKRGIRTPLPSCSSSNPSSASRFHSSMSQTSQHISSLISASFLSKALEDKERKKGAEVKEEAERENEIACQKAKRVAESEIVSSRVSSSRFTSSANASIRTPLPSCSSSHSPSASNSSSSSHSSASQHSASLRNTSFLDRALDKESQKVAELKEEAERKESLETRFRLSVLGFDQLFSVNSSQMYQKVEAFLRFSIPFQIRTQSAFDKSERVEALVVDKRHPSLLVDKLCPFPVNFRSLKVSSKADSFEVRNNPDRRIPLFSLVKPRRSNL